MRSTKSKAKPKFDGPARSYEFEAIGTHWVIDINDLLSLAKYKELLRQIRKLIETFDKHYSRFRTDSLISSMTEKAGEYSLPADAQPLFDFYKQLYEITGGMVTPLIGQTLVDVGYDANYSLIPKKQITKVPAWDEVLQFDFPTLVLKRPILLDFGAAGKGYLVDLVSKLIRKNNIQAFCVDAGGDMFFNNPSQSLDVGLEHPADPSMAIGVVSLENGQSICGSAGNRRQWAGYHHILDPYSLSSPQNLQAVWVVADRAMLADGLTTALFFVDAKLLRKHYTFEYALMRADETVEYSPGLKATFFS